MACEMNLGVFRAPGLLRSDFEEYPGLTTSHFVFGNAKGALSPLRVQLATQASRSSDTLRKGSQDSEDSRLQLGDPTRKLSGSMPAVSPKSSSDDYKSPDLDDNVNDEGETTQEGEGEEKTSRTRNKNRRAQQRFRQRQKAKLQAKEQEALQLQKQLQELQDQLLAFQINGATPILNQQMQQLQSRCQLLQTENNEIRALALLYMDENARLQTLMDQHMALLQSPMFGDGASSAARDTLMIDKQLQQIKPTAPVYSPKSEENWLHLIQDSPLMEPNIPRLAVFKDLQQLPWQVAPSKPETGLPAGCSPGRAQMCILIKILSRMADGSSSVLVRYPPGFVHDYIVSSKDQVEEVVILEGSLTDTVLNQTFCSGDFCRIAPGHGHGPYRADPVAGALSFVVTRRTRR